MPPLPRQRAGQRLQVKGRPIPFSFWPTRAGRRHEGLQSLLFALDPWAVIERAVERDCPRTGLLEALACLEQARDFFVVGTEPGISAARPLALYYSYMNIVKTFCLFKGARPTFNHAQHGLAERLGGGGREFFDAYLDAWPTPNARQQPNNFSEFSIALTGANLARQTSYPLPFLLPQILPGHRLWAQATRKSERFIALHDIQIWHDPANHQLWLKLYVVGDDLSRLGVSHRRFVSEGGLHNTFREVACNEEHDARPLILFEQVNPIAYAGSYPADRLSQLVAVVKSRLWVTVSTVSPYRRYYVYLCPQAERDSLLAQLLSIYAVTYYFGSITRYRPHQYDSLLQSSFGPRVRDFVTGQPAQFIYMMASEFLKQEVTRPSII
jgi:hypothetical protein